MHYKYQFTSALGTDWLIQINDTTLELPGTPKLLRPTDEGFTLNVQGGQDKTYKPICSGSATFEVYVDTNSRALIASIVASGMGRYIAMIYKETVLHWIGFIEYETLSIPDAYEYTGVCTLTAVDGFGYLSDYKYADFVFAAPTEFTWVEWIAKIFEKMPLHFITTEPIFALASVWYEDSMPYTSTDDPLSNTIHKEVAFVDYSDYQDDDASVIEAMTLYDILLQLLETFNLQVSMWNGQYLFIQQNTYAQGTTRAWYYLKDGSYNTSSIINLQETMKARLTGGRWNYYTPLKSVKAVYKYKQGVYKSSLVPPVMELGTTYNCGDFEVDRLFLLTAQVFNTVDAYVTDGEQATITCTYKITIQNGTYYLTPYIAGSIESDVYWVNSPSYFTRTSQGGVVQATDIYQIWTYLNVEIPALVEDGVFVFLRF